MRYFKMQLGTNPHVFDVLTITDDGTMSMDCRVCERLVHYDGLTMEHTPYGERINYGKGSSMPWTDKKGNISARWTEVSCNDATAETEAPTVTEPAATEPAAPTVDDNVQPLPAPVGEGSGVGSVTSTAAEPAEQAQPEVCPAVLPQEPQEEAPTPSPLAQMQAELEALRRENVELRIKNEEFYQREQITEKAARSDQELQALTERELHRQLHRSSSCRISDGQRHDIDRRTGEPAQYETARRNRGAVANSSFFTLHFSFLKPLAVAAASVVACVVIYETGLLIPMGLIGLATSGLVK